MKKIIVLALIVGFMLVVPCYAVNTVTVTGKFIMISAIDSDFLYSSLDATGTIKITAIKFIPGATDDLVVIKEGTDAGAYITQMTSADGEPRIDMSFRGIVPCKPMIDFSESTLTAGSIVIIQRK